MPIEIDGTIAEDKELTVDDAADAILSKWTVKDDEKSDATEPSDTSEDDDEIEEQDADEEDESDEDATEPSEDDEDESDEETDEDEDTDEDEGDDKPKKTLDDNAVVKVKVGEEELEVPVKDLKRLYGQEAALTRKSQAVAAKTKEVEETGAKYVTALSGLLNRARERAEPFTKVDYLVAAKELSTEELQALRTEAQRHFEEVKFLEQELDQFMGQAQQQRQASLVEQAKECVKTLKEEIPEWNEKLYDDLRGFAITQGFDREVINNLVDPVAFKLLHQAYLYNKGQKAVTKKKVKAPKKIVKSTTAPSVTKEVVGKKGVDKAIERVRRTGSVDDATNAFLAKWQKD